MRIISKFRDYYDSAMGQGVDMTRVWVRETQHSTWCTGDRYQHGMVGVQNLDSVPPPSQVAKLGAALLPTALAVGIGHRLRRNDAFVAVYGALFVAGMMYPYARMRIQPDKKGEPATPLGIVFSLEALDAEMGSRGLKRPKESWWGDRLKPEDLFSGKYNWSATLLHGGVITAGVERHDRNYVVVHDPVLADYGFQRVLDPWAAYQELDMYIGNLADPGREMAVVADKDRVVQHGFDKWSFRKQPKDMP